MKIIGYLVGTTWLSVDQGDSPNNFEFPDKFVRDKEEAERAFEQLKKKNQNWGFGYQKAYIAEINNDGTIGERRYE